MEYISNSIKTLGVVLVAMGIVVSLWIGHQVKDNTDKIKGAIDALNSSVRSLK